MKTFRVFFVILVSVVNFISAGYLMADEIHLKNGDRISGEVLNMKDNKLTIKTSSKKKELNKFIEENAKDLEDNNE